MVKTLYISYDGMTDPLGQSQVIPYLIEISKSNFQVSIVSFEKKENSYRTSLVKELLKQNNIKWYPLNYTKFPPIISTLKDIWTLNNFVFSLNKKENFKLVHCRSYLPALTGLKLKNKNNLKFIFDMRGFWADERVDGGIWNLANPVFKLIYKYFKRKELQFFKLSDAIISLTYNGRNEIFKMYPIQNLEDKIHVIPCCTDLNLFDRTRVNDHHVMNFRKQLKFDQKTFVLSYLGSIGTWYMLPEMMSFFKRLTLEKPNAQFLFITQDSKNTIYNEAAKQDIDIDNIKVIKANRSEIPALLSLSSISIFFIKPAFSKKASSPTKHGEIMSMGIPVICNSQIGDTEAILKKHDVGGLVQHFSNIEYDKVISNIEKLLLLDQNDIRKVAEEHYDLKQGVSKYLKIYRELTTETSVTE